MEKIIYDPRYSSIPVVEGQIEIIKNAPVAMRIDILIYIFSQHDPSNVKWDEVERLIKEDIKPGDFNNFSISKRPIESVNDLRYLHNRIVIAESGRVPKYMYKCASCGKEVFIFAKTINRLLNNGFPLPKRCAKCRAERREFFAEFQRYIADLRLDSTVLEEDI